MNPARHRFRRTVLTLTLLLSTLNSQLSTVLAQGPLTPPGAPAPTMRTLDQVEPRIAINATNTPGDADSLYKITQPGSYYLTGNITGVFGKMGIEIAATGVTIDLMGFEMIGGGSTSPGIQAVAETGNIHIRNGNIRNWKPGIDLSQCNYNLLSDLRVLTCSVGGIQGRLATTITNCTVSSNFAPGIVVQNLSVITGCTLQSNGGTGITAGPGAVISHCSLRFNTDGLNVGSGSTISNTTATQNFGRGIVAGDGCTISDCVAHTNTGGDGFSVGKGCTVRHCSAYTNTGGGAGGGDGIQVGDGTSVLDCTSYDNAANGILGPNVGVTVSGCTVYKNGDNGISIGAGTVTRCDSSDNNSDGIRVVSAGRITDNKCFSNGPGSSLGAGIHVIQTDCIIENNLVGFNDYGLDVDSFPNVIIHNSARANVTNNYEVAAGNMLGTIITTTANMNAAANTYANLAF